MSIAARTLPSDPPRVPVARRHAPVEGHGGLEENPGQALGDVFFEVPNEAPRLFFTDVLENLDPRCPQPSDRPGNVRGRIFAADDHALDARGDDRFRARRRATMMVARLEGDVEGSSPSRAMKVCEASFRKRVVTSP